MMIFMQISSIYASKLSILDKFQAKNGDFKVKKRRFVQK